jgi:hypothetical protein
MIDMLQKFDRSSLKSLEPKDLVLARCEAFRRNDFEFVFFSYHADAPFLQAFPDCRDYVQYAEQTLQDAFTINACRVARARQVAADEVQVLFMMEIECEGTVKKTWSLPVSNAPSGGGVIIPVPSVPWRNSVVRSRISHSRIFWTASRWFSFSRRTPVG